jgi:hypothetical protein
METITTMEMIGTTGKAIPWRLPRGAVSGKDRPVVVGWEAAVFLNRSNREKREKGASLLTSVQPPLVRQLNNFSLPTKEGLPSLSL